jgi:hypothetical protein
MGKTHFSTVPPHRALGSVRLTFAYSGEDVRLIRAEPVRKVAPGAPGLPPPDKDSAGYWFDLRDRDGAILYHRILHNPMCDDVEIFDPDARQPISRERREGLSEGEFTILVPDVAAAVRFHLHLAPVGRAEQAAKPRTLAFEMDALRRGESSQRDDGEPERVE